jgi:hypothetical protein
LNRLNLTAAFFGVAFGLLFSAAGLNQYDTIHEMLLLENLEPFLIMGSAMATALPILWILERRSWHAPLGGRMTLRRANVHRGQVVGSAIFGAGWAITGACPGTASTALGAGSLMGIVLILGILTGIGLRDVSARISTSTGPVSELEPATP